MAKILSPNKQYTGISAGVTFVNGVGETANPLLIAWFKEKGYTVEENPVIVEKPKSNPEPEPELKPEPKPGTAVTVKDPKPKPKTTRKKV